MLVSFEKIILLKLHELLSNRGSSLNEYLAASTGTTCQASINVDVDQYECQSRCLHFVQQRRIGGERHDDIR